MALFPKILLFGLLGSGLLVASCQEGNSSHPNPNPKTPPLTIKVTLPPGFHKMDSAAFQEMLRQPGVPDSLPPQRSRAKRNP